MARALILLATYNERENLRDMAEAILGLEMPGVDILIIDDNSPDGTGQIADELSAQHDEVSVVHRKAKLGLGSAQTGGMEIAQLHGYDYVITMDSDFSHKPEYLPRMLERIEGCDLVIGSRYVPGGGTEDWGAVRKLMSWGANFFCRVALGLRPRDCSSGFKCYRVGQLCRVDLSNIVAKGYAFQEEIVYRFQLLEAQIEELPITFVNRQRGQTKMGLKEIFGLFFTVLRLRWRRICARLSGRGGL